jgi:hypothetical protein
MGLSVAGSTSGAGCRNTISGNDRYSGEQPPQGDMHDVVRLVTLDPGPKYNNRGE